MGISGDGISDFASGLRKGGGFTSCGHISASLRLHAQKECGSSTFDISKASRTPTYPTVKLLMQPSPYRIRDSR